MTHRPRDPTVNWKLEKSGPPRKPLPPGVALLLGLLVSPHDPSQDVISKQFPIII